MYSEQARVSHHILPITAPIPKILLTLKARKHEWKSTTKKASDRSWKKLCVVLKEGQIAFYKNEESYRSNHDDTFKGELKVDLNDALAVVANDYIKKANVFRRAVKN